MSVWTYGRCSECTGKRQVWPIGPLNARVMLIGEGPGKNEDKEGVPFVGVSGKEQDHTYFGLAGLDRRDVFISNCIQCRCERGGLDVRPSAPLVAACAANHLAEEIWTVNPEIVILCGATACSLVGLNLELEHGFPFEYSGDQLFGWNGWVVPMYHPAAGLRETRYMIPLLDDWKNLGRWLRGEWSPPRIEKNEYETDYRLARGSLDVMEYLKLAECKWPSIDTESNEGRLYSIQVSTRPGQGLMVLRDDVEAMDMLRWALNEETEGWILHNALYDLEELRQADIRQTHIRDTMQEIYGLGGILPQGLKAAVYRIFGYRMTSYDEVVTPASKQKLDNWLAEALDYSTTSMRESIHHTKGKGCAACGKNHRMDKTEYKPHESEAVIRRVMKHMGEEGSDYDAWKLPTYAKGELKLRLIGRDWLGQVEHSIGRMPRPSIVHAPLERQIQYACGDADWTLRLADWLSTERDRIVREEWRVA